MFSKFLLRSIGCLLCVCTLQAQMTPSAPVQNFRLPRFGDNGYTQWVLQGGKGMYDSAEQIRIEDMALRVYSGDERMALEMTMDSPEATLLMKENRAVSDGPIKIVGSNFKVSGVGWTWNGLTKEIEVKFDVVVEFTQGLEGMVSGAVAVEGETEFTEIRSRSLLLQTTAEAYRFEFTESVHAVSGEMDLKSEVLIAIADAPEGKQDGGSTVTGGGKLDSIHQLIAKDKVIIHQQGHVLKAGHAEFMLRENAAHFSGLPQIETAGAYLSGETINSQEGKVVVTGGKEAGRAQMIVSQAGGLGIMGAEALSSETIVLSEVITMLELEGGSQFIFEGAVDVMSGAMQLSSDTLTLLADSVAEDAPTESGPALQVGEVTQLIAEGDVRIEQADRVATAKRVTFYPQDERADLFGSPRIERGNTVVVGDSMQLTPTLSIVEGSAELRANLGEVIVTGDRMELKPGVAVVQSHTSQRVKVVLPEMPDMGYGNLPALTLKPRTTDAEKLAPTAPGIETVVQSKTLRMIENPENTLFRFTETVSVNGTNLDAICGRLDVTAAPVAATEVTESAEVTSQMEVQMIEAFDNVVFRQAGRVATGDKATIQPIEGKVVLEGNAVVTDEMGKVSGHRMTLLQGQRRAIVEGDRSTGKRATMTLPEMKPKK
ncbi:MAG: lipopolysaccharide export system protein LptA [Lentimonas sp.]|jgi:lipopolysaccharide export system protein LptA